MQYNILAVYDDKLNNRLSLPLLLSIGNIISIDVLFGVEFCANTRLSGARHTRYRL